MTNKNLCGLFLLAALAVPYRLSANDRQSTLPSPIPIKVEEVYHLPFFCVAEGLRDDGNPAHLPEKLPRENVYLPGAPCPGKSVAQTGGKRFIIVPPGNADDVATQLQPQLAPAGSGTATLTAAVATTATATATVTGSPAPSFTQFALSATTDKRSEIIFCRDHCPSGIEDLEKAIYRLAQPAFVYFKDYSIDSVETGEALAKAVAAINPKLSAEVISPELLRVESANPLTDAEISVFENRLQLDLADIEQTPDQPTNPTKQVKADRSGPEPDSQVKGVDLPFFCQANDLETPPDSPDKDGKCPAGTRKVQANNFAVILETIASALGKASSKFTLSRDGSRVLVACDSKCSGPAFDLIKATILTTARPVPQFAEDKEVPRGTSYIAAAALNKDPLTATALTDTLVRISSDTPVANDDLESALERVRQKGFGESEPQSAQRLFYRSAADVVGDLLVAPPPGTQPQLGVAAAIAPATGNTATPAASSTAGGSVPASGTLVNITNNPATPPPTPSAPPPNGPAPIGGVGQGMTAVDDLVVFTDTSSAAAMKQRGRLLTILDLPRPEILMNMWSFQASSPDGRELAATLQHARDLVNANNDSLQQAIEYGWAYLSRKMNDPAFFDSDFHNYLTKRFVADTEACEANDPAAKGCLTLEQRSKWGMCDKGQYCLGYDTVFAPITPSLSSILLGMMAAKDTAKTVLTTIGCMEGKYEVYGSECFPDRQNLARETYLASSEIPGSATECLRNERANFLASDKIQAGDVVSDIFVIPQSTQQRQAVLSCDVLDRAAVAAQRACGLPVTLPLSCFTIQAAKSFLPDSSFSTFSMQRLNSLAEVNLADFVSNLPPGEIQKYSAPSIGLLRSAVVDFLYQYKVATQYPAEFSTYYLPHSAQRLNAELNPLVVAFNQDVAALSSTLLDEIQKDSPNRGIFSAWHHNQSYVANGMITVRGISGVESLVDTDTQSSFDSTQAQTLSAVVNAINGASTTTAAATPTNSTTVNINPDGSVVPPASSSSNLGISCSNGSLQGSPLCAVANLFKGGTTAPGIAAALAAVAPVKSHSIIGRQLTLDVIPHALPGASSAELDVRLWAQEDSAPLVYSDSGTSSNDFVSRVARHNVATRVRVESVKLFDVSSFSAMIQRPRAKLPVAPPFIEIPFIGSLLSLPLPAAKVYHSSSAVVSAIIVPTATDLAYGLQFRSDRAVFPEQKRFSRLDFSLRTLTSQRQLPETDPIPAFHNEMVKCMSANRSCGNLQFSDLPPER